MNVMGQHNRARQGLRLFRLAIILGVCQLLPAAASAALRPLQSGEQTIYQTVQTQTHPQYRTFYSQITGNAYTEEGDEVKADANTTARLVTNIAIATQTNNASVQLEYTPAFIEVTIYVNDGLPDLPGDTPFNDATPDGQLSPGTVLAKSRLSGISYPAGGVARHDTNFVLNFPFNNVLVPEIFTVSIVNLDSNGNPDFGYGVGPGAVNPPPGFQPDSYHFGTFHSTFQVGSPAAPAPNLADPDHNNTAYNTNPWGTSRTGPNINRFTNNGQYNWIEYNGKPGPHQWESDRNSNAGMEMTIYAVVPEPSSLTLAACGAAALAALVRRRRTSRHRCHRPRD